MQNLLTFNQEFLTHKGLLSHNKIHEIPDNLHHFYSNDQLKIGHAINRFHIKIW